MEVLRARAEEVAMGTTGDSQAKLIRQLETLQTQYALSSENWQRIEESLTNRVSGLEKERDEVLQKENDARQKARKSVSGGLRQVDCERSTWPACDMPWYQLADRRSPKASTIPQSGRGSRKVCQQRPNCRARHGRDEAATRRHDS